MDPEKPTMTEKQAERLAFGSMSSPKPEGGRTTRRNIIKRAFQGVAAAILGKAAYEYGENVVKPAAEQDQRNQDAINKESSAWQPIRETQEAQCMPLIG